jgi:two-component system LytT family sensor kinase
MKTDRIRRRRHALEILFLWTGIGLFFAAQRYLRAPSLQQPVEHVWWKSLAGSLLAAYIWAALTPVVMAVARRLRPRRGTSLWRVPLLLLAGAAASLIHLTATNVFWLMVDPAPGSRSFAAMFLATLAFGGAARLATFFGLVGVTWGIDDYRAYREKALEASELERELVQTQLEALKLRLHPPFLFNALAAILPLIRTEPRAAARTVVQLGDILRLALHNDATGLVPLKTEIEYIRLYLQIEQTRLRDRLEVTFAIEPGALEAEVPNFVLLPLIESAIANGVSVRPGRAHITVQARPDADELRVTVHEGPAEPLEPPVVVDLDDSFVRKTKMRLELLYPGQHLVALSDRLEQGHEVQLTIPLSPAQIPSPLRVLAAVQGAA